MPSAGWTFCSQKQLFFSLFPLPVSISLPFLMKRSKVKTKFKYIKHFVCFSECLPLRRIQWGPPENGFECSEIKYYHYTWDAKSGIFHFAFWHPIKSTQDEKFHGKRNAHFNITKILNFIGYNLSFEENDLNREFFPLKSGMHFVLPNSFWYSLQLELRIMCLCLYRNKRMQSPFEHLQFKINLYMNKLFSFISDISSVVSFLWKLIVESSGVSVYDCRFYFNYMVSSWNALNAVFLLK